MDITIQNVRAPALEHNGRFYKVFQPRTRDELLKLHHMGCAGDTVITDIQLEQGDFPTSFVEPAVTQRTLSGLFKDLRSIELELRDQNSTLWSKIQKSNQGALTQFFDTNIKSAIAQTANEIRQEVRNASNSARVQVTSEGVTIGSTTLTGEQLASTISTSPRGVDIIAPKIKVKSDMIVDGAITASKIGAGAITANALDAGSVTADKVKFDTAFIQRLVSQQAFVDELFSKQATITKIQSVDLTANHIKGGVLTSINGNSTFDLNAGRIQMQSDPTGWRTSWDSNGIAFRGSNNAVWGAMGGDSGGGVGIYMRGDHAFNLVVNHADQGKSYAYTALRVKYGEGTTLQFSPGGPSYNLLTLFRTIFDNFKYNKNNFYDMK